MSLRKIIFLLLFATFISASSTAVKNRRKQLKVTSVTATERKKFQSWKEQHKKVYQSQASEERAMANMIANLREIEEHNKLFEAGKVSYSRAVWEFSDLSFDEKIALLAGERPVELPLNETKIGRLQAGVRLKSAPPEVNWVKEGLVNPVQNQRKCGSCWTYAAAGVAEGALLRKGIDTVLSTQYLVDCSKNGGNAGCNGGDSFAALKYLANNGIPSMDDYPYTAKDGRCRGKSIRKVPMNLGRIKYERLRGNENRLKTIIANFGPVAIAMRAADSFMNYKSGVYDNPKCSRNLDHAMLAVGYGTDNKTKKDYWLIKNSWGTSWGEDGYVRMSRNKNNQCGIAVEVVYIIPPD